MIYVGIFLSAKLVHRATWYGFLYVLQFLCSSQYRHSSADASGRAVEGVGLRPLVWWDCGFGSRPGHSCDCCVLLGRGLCDCATECSVV